MNKMLNKIGLISAVMGSLVICHQIFVGIGIPLAIAGSKSKFQLPKPPNRGGVVGNRFGSASRQSDQDPTLGTTRSNRKILTAFVPAYVIPVSAGSSKAESTKVWGLTAKENPAVWFYIPYSEAIIARIDFNLKDQDSSNKKTVYQTSILPAKQGGIVGFSLPKNLRLAVDHLYQWELQLTMKIPADSKISPPPKAEKIAVTGWIQRKNLTSILSREIKQSILTKQADLYAVNGYWYDAFATVAELRRAHPQDLEIQKDWENMLELINLEELADLPFLKP
jgi:Domain of Unknown Function (DUF928)